MRPRFALVSCLLPVAIIAACSSSGDDVGSTGSTATSTGGAAGSAQAGSAQAGTGQAGTGQAGTGQAGTGQAGTGQAGTGQAGTGQAGTGQAGSGQAGSPGGCCATVKCGGAHPVCVEGSCFDLKPGECFSSSDCAGKPCNGVTICGCGDQCLAGTKPGTCEGAVDWSSCGVPGECTIANKGCCGVCGQPAAKDVDAVNRSKLTAHFDAVCTSDPVCPACPSAPNPDLMGVCALGQGKCVVLEVSSSGFSVCKADGDCALRANSCCACGELSPTSIVAVAASQSASYLNELGCAAVDCAPCADPPKPPAGFSAKCDLAVGHCQVVKP